jgi:hypothetical protein
VLVVALVSCNVDGSSTSDSRSPATSATSSSASVDVPNGIVAFNRVGADGVEHYFTSQTEGSNEHALFSAEGCNCIWWSPDGTEVWSVAMTELETLAFTTMNADGTDRMIHPAPIESLNLAPGAGTSDGLIAFSGWDESEPSNSGIWLGSRDLNDLEQVTPLPEGVIATEVMGITPDASRILFFAETGSVDYVTHAGDLFVVNSDGSGLRQLNADSLSLSMVTGRPASLSPDGRRAVFSAFEGEPSAGRSAVFVASLAGGVAEQVTDWTGGLWTATWAPVGETITYAKWWDDGSVVSVVRSDGSGDRTLSAEADEVGHGAWSPDGEYLLVSRGPEQARDLWILGLDGSYVGQVTRSPSHYAVYSWAPS